MTEVSRGAEKPSRRALDHGRQLHKQRVVGDDAKRGGPGFRNRPIGGVRLGAIDTLTKDDNQRSVTVSAKLLLT